MFWKIVFISMLGSCLASHQRRFIFTDQKNTFPNSPFGGGGSGGVSSPFGSGSGSGGVSSPFGGSGGMTEGGSSSAYSPCVPSQGMCSLQCANGYVKGPSGCDFCMCNNNAQSETTMGPVLIDPVDIKTTTTASPQVASVTTKVPSALSQTTSVDCIAAKLSCVSSCGDKGYLVDPSDCTFCLCKNSMVFQ